MEKRGSGRIDRRLARVEGQVRGLRRMVAEDAYCIDVLTQVAAARSALDQVAAELAANHVRDCILGHDTDAAHPQARAVSPDDLMDELRTTLSRLVR